MKTVWVKTGKIIAVVGVVLVLSYVPTAVAQQSSSPHYSVNEVFFGSGGQDYCPVLSGETSPGNYCALVTAGELTIGNTKGAQFQAYGGFNTARNPFIELDVLQSSVDLGVVSPTRTGYGTAQFQVKAYLASGYVVQIAGPTPTNGTHAVPAMNNTAAPTMGTEQFGINLAANNMVVQQGQSAVAFGNNAQQDLDGTFSFGYVNNDTGSNMVYNVANEFKYASGDIIARADSSTSFTLYTISYIMNASPVTPGGVYTTDQTIIATATY